MNKSVESFVNKHGYPPTVNSAIADIWCIWCQSEPGEIHSLACPNGERYKYFQLLGQSGIPIPAVTRLENAMSRETNLNDSQRAQLLQMYKSKLLALGDEAFFDDFDSIRLECYSQMGINIEEIEAQERSNAASKLGKRGGESTSDDKVKAARENGRKGGRKKGNKSINQLGLSLEDI